MERRTDPRINTQVTCEISSEYGESSGITQDISLGGAKIMLDFPLPEGTQGDASFFESNMTFNLKIEVIHSGIDSSSVNFVAVSPKMLAELKKLLQIV
jgi:hypothetical protein